MKANEAPEKIYVHIKYKPCEITFSEVIEKECSNIEYTRTDAFIEKACEFLKSYRQNTYDGTGYIAGVVNDKTIEDFRNYMKGE